MLHAKLGRHLIKCVIHTSQALAFVLCCLKDAGLKIWFYFFLNYTARFMSYGKERNTQMVFEHINFVLYQYCYMFRPREVIIKLALEHFKQNIPIALTGKRDLISYTVYTQSLRLLGN